MIWVSKVAAQGRDINDNALEVLNQILELINGHYVYNEENQGKYNRYILRNSDCIF